MKRILAIFATIAILAVFAAGCGGGESTVDTQKTDAGTETK